MPSVKPGCKVLVTGASGFIAAWVVKGLLDKGFYVRGTVRSASKGDFLVNLFKEHGNRFEYVVVEDIAKEGAFDEAMKGIDAVEHVASPVTLETDPDALIIPAVKGTVGVLTSVLKHGPAVQRVVITSSCATIWRPASSQQQTLDENSWNEFSVQEVKDKGREADQLHKYRASKVLAERAAWEFVENHKSSITWDLITLLPSWVTGPTIHDMTSVASSGSVGYIYNLFKGRLPITTIPPGGYVDVRDVVTAHVNAVTTERAGGQRFIISSDVFTWQEFFDTIHSAAQSDPALSTLPKGIPGAGKDAVYPNIYDSSKAQNVLGVTFRKLAETAPETASNLLEKERTFGW